MATFESAIHAAQKADRANPARLPAPNQASGGVHLATVPYTLTGEEMEEDEINLCILPAGAIPVPGSSFIVAEVTALEPTPTPS